MVTIVAILVAVAAFQGVYNLVKEASYDFPLVDPADEFGTPPERTASRAA